MYKKLPFYSDKHICMPSRRRVFRFIVWNSRLTYRKPEFSRLSATALFGNVHLQWESVRKDAVVRVSAASRNGWSGIFTDLPGPKEETREDLVRGRRAVRHWWHPSVWAGDSNFWNHGISTESIAGAGASNLSLSFGRDSLAKSRASPFSLKRKTPIVWWKGENERWVII